MVSNQRPPVLASSCALRRPVVESAMLDSQSVAKVLKKLFLIISILILIPTILTKNQSGFRQGDSTTNQLLFLVDEIHQAFEDRNSLEIRVVFLDISKAFDKVSHDDLIFKLKQNGISGSLLKLFKNYLHNRKQRVVLNGSFSDYF